ncbi:hypothetical protein P152DRAFT_139148 [Eremomyces bilateralis CBS 781.70]|uniref:Uncharacterized protein n=1 Tax=Eremomyces bilateralis CBS 781.70 TaxID=1392243 RepID=A0A6G1FW65_9PEZI|nr:uncharacterized protein P152DRAFT_139148 [Eremomyces bilateralis CBS 781.70]KAF1810077.1 hypothetical protein P152DRAFT_139148 [Eremomyces bilateralis CBS 781.70]
MASHRAAEEVIVDSHRITGPLKTPPRRPRYSPLPSASRVQTSRLQRRKMCRTRRWLATGRLPGYGTRRSWLAAPPPQISAVTMLLIGGFSPGYRPIRNTW